MTLLISENTLVLWHEVIKTAEHRSCISLNDDLEAYLISLLMRYSNKPEVAQQIFAKSYLEAMQQRDRQRNHSLQQVGDQCLLFAGLFPHHAEKRHVSLTYFVDLGRTAYAAISHTANDLYWVLALQFVALMDVLQSIRTHETPDLLPLEAYEQWHSLGSQHALRVLQSYSKGIPVKR